ncbi:MAG: 16S rRNA (guanine(966)-N(2))-methyltransferase RsmD [Candidatus Margulisbacteria bacterium]|nr:16S rRNA (guanine(966)-N(2))-methyltransferase RsmD [Candidatus Margulisiibacteriota bacterium]
MHVIAGKYKGMALDYESKRIRPTTSKVRGAVFSILGDRIDGAQFLELFCGSAAMSIEALSRGVDKAVAIDVQLDIAYKNKTRLKLGNLFLYKKRAEDAVKILGKKQEQFDIIFIDPPYGYKGKNELLLSISKFDILKADGILLFEAENSDKEVENSRNFELIKTYQYGQSQIICFRNIK